MDKIFGPGNRLRYRRKASGERGLRDRFARGADGSDRFRDGGNPKFMAADLIAQAEHDPDAISDFRDDIDQTGARRAGRGNRRAIGTLPQTNLAHKSLAKNGAVLVAKNVADAARFVNRFAAEHLTLPGRRTDCSTKIDLREAFSWAIGARRPLATTRLEQTTCYRPGGAARTRGGPLGNRLREVHQRAGSFREGFSQLAPVARNLRRQKGCWRTAFPWRCGNEAREHCEKGGQHEDGRPRWCWCGR